MVLSTLPALLSSLPLPSTSGTTQLQAKLQNAQIYVFFSLYYRPTFQVYARYTCELVVCVCVCVCVCGVCVCAYVCVRACVRACVWSTLTAPPPPAALGLLSCVILMFVISPEYAGLTVGKCVWDPSW